MKAADGNGYAYKHYCLATVVDETLEGPALATCSKPLPSHGFSGRLPENKVDLCQPHLMAKLRRKHR